MDEFLPFPSPEDEPEGPSAGAVDPLAELQVRATALATDPAAVTEEAVRELLAYAADATGLDLAVSCDLREHGRHVVSPAYGSAADNIARSRRSPDLGGHCVSVAGSSWAYGSFSNNGALYAACQGPLDFRMVERIRDILTPVVAHLWRHLKDLAQEATAQAFLNLNPNPVFVSDKNRNVLASNVIFKRQARSNSAPFRQNGHGLLEMRDPLLDSRIAKEFAAYFEGTARTCRYFACPEVTVELHPFALRNQVLVVLRYQRDIEMQDLEGVIQAFSFTDREADVMLALINSQHPKDAAKRLGIKLSTFQWNTRGLREKVGVHTTRDLVATVRRYMC